MQNKIKDLEEKLLRKEQECEELKNSSDEWMSRCEQEAKLREFIGEQLEQLKAENGELREENFTFEQLIKEYEKYGTIEEIIKQLDQLKAENNELKEQLKKKKN